MHPTMPIQTNIYILPTSPLIRKRQKLLITLTPHQRQRGTRRRATPTTKNQGNKAKEWLERAKRTTTQSSIRQLLFTFYNETLASPQKTSSRERKTKETLPINHKLTRSIMSIAPNGHLGVYLSNRISIPLILQVVTMTTTSILRPLGSIRSAINPNRQITRLSRSIMLIMNRTIRSINGSFHFFKHHIAPTCVINRQLIVRKVARTSPHRLIMPRQRRMTMTICSVTRIPLTMPPPSIIRRPRRVNLIYIRPTNTNSNLNTINYCTIIITPKTKIIKLDFNWGNFNNLTIEVRRGPSL